MERRDPFPQAVPRGGGRRWLPPLLLAAVPLLLPACATGVRVKNTDRTFTAVVVDPGHGGWDSGAARNGILEKDAALDVGRRLQGKLAAAGFKTVLSRDRDIFISLDRRVAIANRQHNAVFVSIHFNYAKGRRFHGVETYYHHRYAIPLARAIQGEMARLAPPDRGVKQARFRVLRRNGYPAVLVECGFVTNRREARRIADPAFRDQVADAIARAIIGHRYPGGPPGARHPATAGAGGWRRLFGRPA